WHHHAEAVQQHVQHGVQPAAVILFCGEIAPFTTPPTGGVVLSAAEGESGSFLSNGNSISMCLVTN
ncbi:hypothetical protein ACTJKU_40840, partial [Citrobacter freundii]